MSEFEKQVCQIAALGAWSMVTGQPMKKRLTQITDPRWDQKLGLFVTFTINNQIRGSMGLIESDQTLAETLFEVGGMAATHDTRHAPLTKDELPDLEIEVTLISQFKKLKSPDDIAIGQTGVMVSRGKNRGILLPKVAEKFGWSQEQFLEAACEKAELSHKAWKDLNTLTEVFTAQVIKSPSLKILIEEYI